MKVFGTIMKIVAALAVVAGIVYVVATYGDKIVAWAKNLLERCKGYCNSDFCCEDDCCCEGECACEEAPAEEAEANDADFEG